MDNSYRVERRLKEKNMKINFSKISALATSMLMVGMTAGVAAAANYPAPFVVGGAADVAVVFGTGAGVSVLDTVEAGNIQSNLQSFMSGSSASASSATGGDVFKFEKSSTKFHLGDKITDVISTSIDEDELPVLLADGIFVDDDNDEFDFTQKIDIGGLTLTMFEDNDYIEDEPTIGFKITSGSNILNYTIEFSDEPLVTDLATSDLVLMGKTYYILSQTFSGADMTLTLLDSAEDTILQEGSTAVVNGKSVSIDFISSTEVAFAVDGEFTNTLAEAETQKLSDGSYLGVKDIRFSSKDGTLSSVEFSIGEGKLKLASGSDIQINDDSVTGLSNTIVNTSTTLTSIKLVWDAEDDMFITETGDGITLPEFKSVKLSFGGLTYPTEEVIEVQQGGNLYAQLNNFPIKDGEVDINFLYGTSAGAFSGIGKDSNNRLVTDATNITYDRDTDDYFVVSWSDGNDAESYLMRATAFITESSVDKLDFEYKKNGVWVSKKTKAKDGDTFSIGNVDLLVGAVSNTDNSVVVTNNSANTNFNTLYSATGLKIWLPTLGANETTTDGIVNFSTNGDGGKTGHNATSFYLAMYEEDKNGNIAHADGDWINLTIGWDNSATAEVEVSAVDTENSDVTPIEIQDTDVERAFTYSALATEILFNKPSGSAQNSIKIIYHGDEVAADVFITSSDAVITAGSAGTAGGGVLGDILVKDSEVSSVSSRHLIVIGGSCINSVAANLVGGALCSSAWTDATGVGSGQFLIQSFGDAYSTGKIALLVAGYEATDTVNAATYLKNQVVDTAAGNKYVGTTSTAATLQVAS